MRFFATVFLFIFFWSGLGACSWYRSLCRPSETEPAATDKLEPGRTKGPRSREALTAENQALQQKVRDLERRLALESQERAAQGQLLAQMREDLLAAVEEATQGQAAAKSGSQAEAVAGLAEAKIALEKARKFPLAEQVKNHLDSADRMVAAASRQLQVGNYNGAVYFARSAQRTVEGALRLARIEAERDGRLLTVTQATANLRQGPSTQSSTVARLAKGTRVISLEKQGDWIKIYLLETGATGWMHASLLR